MKMKGFLEVFPGLHMTEQMTELMGLVEVEKVSMSRDRSSIRISVVSPRLIHRKNIMDLERGIRDQLFPGKRLQVRIFEKYRLSGQYTPEKLLGAYRDSLLTELKNYSIVEYTMFRKARFSFPQPDLMHMTVEDTMVNKEKAGELKRILEKVFHERCGLPVEIVFDYVEPVQAKAFLEREKYARQEGVSAQGGHAGSGAKSGEEPPASAGPALPAGNGRAAESAKRNGQPNAGVKEKRGGIRKGDWSTGGGYRKKSDNPDVLYGRDFEDDFVEIDKIEGEIGEVTVRGKILDRDEIGRAHV